MEQSFVKKNDDRFWVNVKTRSLKQDDLVEYYLGIWEDLTERKSAQTKLEESVKEWQNTFDSIADMVSIQDRECRLLKVNRPAGVLKNTGRVDGQHCYNQSMEQLLVQLSPIQTLQTGQPATGSYYEPKLGLHLEVTTSPILDPAGEITGSIHIARDISEHVRSEEKLRKSEAGYRNLFDTMAQGVVYYDGQGRITSMNPAAENILGFSLAQVADQTLLDSPLKYLRRILKFPVKITRTFSQQRKVCRCPYRH
jgi:PAS domain-containing protein